MNPHFSTHLTAQLDAIRAAGTYKRERVLSTPQGSLVRANGGKAVLNMCANNYLGLAQHPRVRQAAHEALEAADLLDRPDLLGKAGVFIGCGGGGLSSVEES